MKVVIRPVLDPEREIDVTRALTRAIAEELWRQFGGNDRLNWLEAELHLSAIVSAEGERVVRFVRAESGAMVAGVTPDDVAGRGRSSRPAGKVRRGRSTRQHRGALVRRMG